MHAQYGHRQFTLFFGLLVVLLVSALPIVPLMTGWAYAAGSSPDNVPPGLFADSNHPGGSQGALVESAGMELAMAEGMVLASRFRSPLVIPAADFRNDGNGPNAYRFWPAYGYIDSQGGIVCMQAPAYLPNNVTVARMNVSFYDNAPALTTREWLRLYRVSKDTGVAETMATAMTTGTSTAIQNVETSAIVNPLVVYPTYSYYVGGCLYDINQRLYSVMLYYTGL